VLIVVPKSYIIVMGLHTPILQYMSRNVAYVIAKNCLTYGHVIYYLVANICIYFYHLHRSEK